MMRPFAMPLGFCVAAALATLLGGDNMLDQYYRDLGNWRDVALTAPEGAATKLLFDQAVETGAIAWNPKMRSIELRRHVVMPAELRNALFRVGEAGAVIARELDRTRALGGYVALRMRYRDCRAPCETPTRWIVRSDSGRSDAEALALGAARARRENVPDPLPRLHFRLSRSAGGGYAPWRAWHTMQPLIFDATLDTADQIDVIGSLESVPPGWRVRDRWCRDGRGRLTECGLRDIPAAVRLERTADHGTISLSIAPEPVMPMAPEEGTHHLSDRLTLNCDGRSRCVPGWLPKNGARRFARQSRPETGQSPDPRKSDEALDGPQPPGAVALGPWAESTGRSLLPSALVREVGAEAVIGGLTPRSGSVISAARDLPENTPARVTLDPVIQRAAHEVLAELVQKPAGGAFANLKYPSPTGGRRVSLVVLDLRTPSTLGAIRAAVGVPRPPRGRSRWDAAAAPHDARSPLAPGVAAWTGRGWHQTPGSAWKLFSTLVLIDAISGGTLPTAASDQLRRAMTGLTAAQADRALGDGVLSGQQGICVPRQLHDGARGTDKTTCGPGYFAAIRDSGAGGPLRAHPNFRFGVAEALAVSSNIWFVAAIMRAEASLPDGTLGSLLAKTAERLGFTAPASLDSGKGLDLDARDAASIEVLDDPGNVQALAFAAFGQRLQAGPLILAQLAASIATGRDVRPGLFEPLPPVAPLFAVALADPLLAEVRRGMRGVVSGKAVGPGGRLGTAHRPFRQRARELRSRIAGKTGTAQRDEGLDRVSSFTGWLDDRKGKPAFAIGCTAAVRGRKVGDSKVRVPQLCAHATAELMRRLDQRVLSP